MNSILRAGYASAYIPSMGIAERIDQMMRERRIKSQSALSRASGVPQPTIARILGGRNTPEMATVLKLSGALGVTAAWLLEGKDAAPEYTGTPILKTSYDAEATRAFRTAQVERAVQLLESLDDSALSRALALLQEFSTNQAEAPQIKHGTGGRRTAVSQERTGTDK